MGIYKVTSPQCSGSATITVTRTRSRIEYRGNGEFHLNVENLNRVTRNNFRLANMEPKNWPRDSNGNVISVGLDTRIGLITFPAIPVQEDFFPFGVDPEHGRTRTVGENSKSKGIPDGRVGRNVPTAGTGTNAPRVGAGGMIAINIAISAVNMWVTLSPVMDMNALRKQAKILEEEVSEAVYQAIDNGNVPLQYLNLNDLGAIVNFVFQGINDTGNQDITRIGTLILRNNGRYDISTGKVQPFLR